MAGVGESTFFVDVINGWPQYVKWLALRVTVSYIIVLGAPDIFYKQLLYKQLYSKSSKNWATPLLISMSISK